MPLLKAGVAENRDIQQAGGLQRLGRGSRQDAIRDDDRPYAPLLQRLHCLEHMLRFHDDGFEQWALMAAQKFPHLPRPAGGGEDQDTARQATLAQDHREDEASGQHNEQPKVAQGNRVNCAPSKTHDLMPIWARATTCLSAAICVIRG